jgi:ribosomal protein L37AE/L43A
LNRELSKIVGAIHESPSTAGELPTHRPSGRPRIGAEHGSKLAMRRAGDVCQGKVGETRKPCRHDRCPLCDETGVSERSSAFWICHRCGELNKRTARPRKRHRVGTAQVK